MPLSMHDVSVPVFKQMLSGLSGIIDKAGAFAAVRKIDPNVILGARLALDMFPFSRQVQLSSDHAKGAVARLAGVEVPRYADTEASFDELKARIAKTADFIERLDKAAFDGAETRPIVLTTGGRERTLPGQTYFFSVALPNFYFHVTTAYDILRHYGLEIGKRDFLGG
jgi:hypothetical protein